jgi:hypothetical protein
MPVIIVFHLEPHAVIGHTDGYSVFYLFNIYRNLVGLAMPDAVIYQFLRYPVNAKLEVGIQVAKIPV